jgi:hypothetical protein
LIADPNGFLIRNKGLGVIRSTARPWQHLICDKALIDHRHADPGTSAIYLQNKAIFMAGHLHFLKISSSVDVVAQTQQGTDCAYTENMKIPCRDE